MERQVIPHRLPVRKTRRKFIYSSLLLVLTGVLALAADIDGKGTQTLTLKADAVPATSPSNAPNRRLYGQRFPLSMYVVFPAVVS